MLHDAFLLLVAVYCVFVLLIALSLARPVVVRSRTQPSVSIVIAARNEEHTIGRCLSSLALLEYPADLMEIIVVNDHSTDRTATVARESAPSSRRVIVIDAPPQTDHLKGKANALAAGIAQSSGEIILMTDADCTVGPHWVTATVAHYGTGKTGIVAGFTMLRGKGVFAGIQALDWFALFSVAAGAVGLGVPLTAVGTNISVRRTAYDLTGGYERLPFSVTEDYALFHAVTGDAGYSAAFPSVRDALVTSDPCGSWPDLIRQKIRWFRGGAGMAPWQIALFFLLYAFHVAVVLAALAGRWDLAAQGLAAKTAADLLLLLPTLVTFRRPGLLLYILPFELFFFLYVLLIPPVIATGLRVRWKERSY